MSLENLLRILPTQREEDSFYPEVLASRVTRSVTGLTDGVDVEEVDGRADDGVEHAVVQHLSRPHQHVEDQQAPDVAKHHSSSGQT